MMKIKDTLTIIKIINKHVFNIMLLIINYNLILMNLYYIT